MIWFKRHQTFGDFIDKHGEDDDIILLVERAKKVNRLCGVECEELSTLRYGQVCDIRESYQESPILAIKTTLDCHKLVPLKTILESKQTEAMYFWAWLHSQLIGIKNAEDKLDTGDPLMEEAGAGELAKYGHINVVDGLAGGDMTKWAGIYAMKYEEVYTKLLKDKETEEIKKRYHELTKPK